MPARCPSPPLKSA
ncbi:hypothetical protein EC80566_0296, partial [Escherichia coli 8.0566]